VGVGVGVVAGLAGAAMSVRLVESLLFGVSTYDPTTFVAAATALVAVAMFACVLPAARATRTDPMVTLRTD
jgi:putative ABC transport system permease protein